MRRLVVCVCMCVSVCVGEKDREKDRKRETDVMNENSFLAHATTSLT